MGFVQQKTRVAQSRAHLVHFEGRWFILTVGSQIPMNRLFLSALSSSRTSGRLGTFQSRAFSTSSGSVLLIAEQNNNRLESSTLNAISAARFQR